MDVFISLWAFIHIPLSGTSQVHAHEHERQTMIVQASYVYVWHIAHEIFKLGHEAHHARLMVRTRCPGQTPTSMMLFELHVLVVFL